MGKRNRKAKPIVLREFDGPSKEGMGQVLDIETFNAGTVGTGKRYRNVGADPLMLAWKRGAIDANLYDAGEAFRKLYVAKGRSGLDSTQALDRSGGGGASTPFTDRQVHAIRQIEAIERGMYAQNYKIIRNFCGEGMSARESIESVLLDWHPNGIWDRMKEALRNLDVVLEKLRISKAA